MYGNTECKYNNGVANPYYLTTCLHPEKGGTIKGSECGECEIFNINMLSMNQLLRKLDDKEKEKVRKYIVKLIS